MARDTNEKVELKKPTIKKISEQVVAPQDVELPVKKAVVKNEAARNSTRVSKTSSVKD